LCPVRKKCGPGFHWEITRRPGTRDVRLPFALDGTASGVCGARPSLAVDQKASSILTLSALASLGDELPEAGDDLRFQASCSQQLNVDYVKISLATLRQVLVAFAVIGCSLSSVGAVTAHAQYYYHHHRYHHRHPYYYRHHRYYRYY
jgi:hypothetical protein